MDNGYIHRQHIILQLCAIFVHSINSEMTVIRRDSANSVLLSISTLWDDTLIYIVVYLTDKFKISHFFFAKD